MLKILIRFLSICHLICRAATRVASKRLMVVIFMLFSTREVRYWCHMATSSTGFLYVKAKHLFSPVQNAQRNSLLELRFVGGLLFHISRALVHHCIQLCFCAFLSSFYAIQRNYVEQ